ncbi:hypothetical protein I7I50_09361 [Histoplasma capsulatum G186AR]|uniref:Uncharacterized protein n=1 Tax=Ajellomyces capsulatus TaxID=5037 RepID=A0A8H7YVA7_AJECA|nr:hypothetical protein I7I52_06882 [Histoplasma capsulatum]QSS74261.1 hypothetical protein I7I50_09361 [Histoplasma capsulatum G186AR]
MIACFVSKGYRRMCIVTQLSDDRRHRGRVEAGMDCASLNLITSPVSRFGRRHRTDTKSVLPFFLDSARRVEG